MNMLCCPQVFREAWTDNFESPMNLLPMKCHINNIVHLHFCHLMHYISQNMLQLQILSVFLFTLEQHRKRSHKSDIFYARFLKMDQKKWWKKWCVHRAKWTATPCMCTYLTNKVINWLTLILLRTLPPMLIIKPDHINHPSIWGCY